MPNDQIETADQHAAHLVRCVLADHGFEVDLLIVDASGVRVSAHRPSENGRFLTRPGYKDAEL